MKTTNLLFALRILPTLLLAVSLLGCASDDARKHAEGVAKGWCETIRAGQVIAVYPLTEDLRVGDVFLVRTPISRQESDYKAKGFLALDDHRARLPVTNFSTVYFDGYWRDTFAKAPHEPITFTNNSSNALTFAEAPRAAFPTYSFQAKDGFGVSAAFPIQGIPVALSFLNSQYVNGSVSISDARTYAADEDKMLSLLQEWSTNGVHKSSLADAAKAASPEPVYLRVVSRVYMARAVDISLQRASQAGGSAQVGQGSNVSILDADGGLNEKYTNLLNALNSFNTVGTAASQIGGSVKFTSASASTVGLSQAFDRLLVIGYLGFDVPVFENGSLGLPLPTFQRLTGSQKSADEMGVFIKNMDTLQKLSEADPSRGFMVISNATAILQSREFDFVDYKIQVFQGSTKKYSEIKPLIGEFRRAAYDYLGPETLRIGSVLRIGKSYRSRCAQFNLAFSEAFRRVPRTAH